VIYPHRENAFVMTDTCLPLLTLVLRHPIVIPPSDEFDNTYKLQTKKYPETIEMVRELCVSLILLSYKKSIT